MEAIRRPGITSNPEYIRAFTKELNERNKESRTRTFVISDGGVDRHNTVLNMKGWNLDNFNANPIVTYQHQFSGAIFGDSNPDNILGPGKAYLEKERKLGEVLLGEVDFEPEDINPLAEKILRKVDHGTLRATSVSFIETGKGETRDIGCSDVKAYHMEGQELIEFAIVNVPSNPRTLKRQLEDITVYLKNNFKEEELAEIFEKMGFKYNHILADETISHTAGGAQLTLEIKEGRIEQTMIEKIIKKLNL